MSNALVPTGKLAKSNLLPEEKLGRTLVALRDILAQTIAWGLPELRIDLGWKGMVYDWGRPPIYPSGKENLPSTASADDFVQIAYWIEAHSGRPVEARFQISVYGGTKKRAASHFGRLVEAFNAARMDGPLSKAVALEGAPIYLIQSSFKAFVTGLVKESFSQFCKNISDDLGMDADEIDERIDQVCPQPDKPFKILLVPTSRYARVSLERLPDGCSLYRLMLTIFMEIPRKPLRIPPDFEITLADWQIERFYDHPHLRLKCAYCGAPFNWKASYRKWFPQEPNRGKIPYCDNCLGKAFSGSGKDLKATPGKQRLIGDLKNLYGILGFPPPTRMYYNPRWRGKIDLKKHLGDLMPILIRMNHQSVYKETFGEWAPALAAAGIPIPARMRKRISSEQR